MVKITKEIISDIAEYHYVTTFQDARNLLDDNTFDLIIVDISLPDGSVLDLIPVIDKKTSIIFFSGDQVEEDIKKQICASLTKSNTSNEQLLTTIKRVINETKSVNVE